MLLQTSPSPRLALGTFALLMAVSASAAPIFSQDFNTGSMANNATAGTTYTNGSPVWRVTDDATGGTPVTWTAGTLATGWTANTSAGYVRADGNGTLIGAGTTYFAAQGWNTGNAPIVQIDLKFTITPKSGATLPVGAWGALVLSNTPFTNTTVPGGTAQVGHVRFGLDASGTTANAFSIKNTSNAEYGGLGNGGFASGVGNINTLSILYNGSVSSFGGIASNQARIVLNGVTIASSTSIGHHLYAGGPAVLNYIELRAFADIGTTQAFFDDIAVTAIPEPSSFAALAGLGALGLVGLRRRRRA